MTQYNSGNYDYVIFVGHIGADLITSGDPIPWLQFQRTWNDKPIKNVYLYGMEYASSLNPFDIHMEYFTQGGPQGGKTNLEKTVNAILDNVD